MTQIRSISRNLVILAAGLLLLAASLLLFSQSQAGAVETSGTIQACVSRFTGEVIVRQRCGANEDWLLLEGVYNNPPPPARPTATSGPSS